MELPELLDQADVSASADYLVAERQPALDGALVPRPRLVRRLRHSPAGSLIVITAPAGYGKSTLLNEWAASDDLPFLSITLRGAQDARAAALALIAAAAERGFTDHPPPPAATGADFASAVRTLVTSSRLDRHSAVVVLDDAHAIDQRQLGALTAELRAQLGRHCRLVIASRRMPPLRLGGARARRQLLELGTEDLRMTVAEATLLLQGVGRTLDPELVTTLVGQTEGWPAILYLASLVVGDGADETRGLDPADRVIDEYLRDEVLADLTCDQLSFLRRASVLRRPSGPICDAVLGRRDSGAMLLELAERNALLVPHDRARERFDWYGVFRSTLESQLRRFEPALAPELHARACDWYRARGETDAAIEHAIAAGEPELAGELIWSRVAPLLADGSDETVRRWLGHFTAEQLAGCAALALSAACCRLLDGPIEEARHWSRLAVGAAGGSGSPPIASAATAISVIEAAAAKRGPAQMARGAARAYGGEAQHSPWLAACRWLGGTGLHLLGDPDRAAPLLTEGADRASVDGSLVQALCLAQLAIVASDREQSASAGELADQAIELVAAHERLDGHPMTALVFAVAATTRAAAGRVDSAKRDLRRGVDHLAARGEFTPWYDAETRIFLARAAIGLSDSVRARTLLAEASRCARRIPEAAMLIRWLDDAWGRIDTLAEANLSGPSSLTIAELRVLRFLPGHLSSREIAQRLGVSVNTVKSQVHTIYRKLDVTSRSQAVQRASDAGLLGS